MLFRFAKTFANPFLGHNSLRFCLSCTHKSRTTIRRRRGRQGQGWETSKKRELSLFTTLEWHHHHLHPPRDDDVEIFHPSGPARDSNKQAECVCVGVVKREARVGEGLSKKNKNMLKINEWKLFSEKRLLLLLPVAIVDEWKHIFVHFSHCRSSQTLKDTHNNYTHRQTETGSYKQASSIIRKTLERERGGGGRRRGRQHPLTHSVVAQQPNLLKNRKMRGRNSLLAKQQQKQKQVRKHLKWRFHFVSDWRLTASTSSTPEQRLSYRARCELWMQYNLFRHASQVPKAPLSHSLAVHK